MLIDRGFFVDNFVGTYGMLYDPKLDCTLIISKEVNHADIDNGEIPLRKKRIFEFDSRNDDYIFLNLANVDISSDDSILAFCNQYGLPYSTQLCYDNELGIGPDLTDNYAMRISRRESKDMYSRRDTMDRLEFCRLAVHVHNLMELKVILNSKSPGVAIYSKLIPLLTYLVFYSRAFAYDYDNSDVEMIGVLPNSPIMYLQYCFNCFLIKNPSYPILLTPAQQIVSFISHYKYLLLHPDRVTDPIMLSKLNAEVNLKLIGIFEKIFIETPSLADNSQEVSLPDIILEFAEDNKLSSIKVNKRLKDLKNQFQVDEYYRVTFLDKIEYTGDVSELIQLGYEVIRDVINEGLTRITPEMILDGHTLRGEWHLDHQMQGVYMELFPNLPIMPNTGCAQILHVGNFSLLQEPIRLRNTVARNVVMQTANAEGGLRMSR